LPNPGSGSIAAGNPCRRFPAPRLPRPAWEIFMHRFELRVRYGDTDQMGFAYYAHYLRWFEIGRAEMLRSLGWGFRGVEEPGTQRPVLEARCRYLKPARYDDELWIETGVLEVRRA